MSAPPTETPNDRNGAISTHDFELQRAHFEGNREKLRTLQCSTVNGTKVRSSDFAQEGNAGDQRGLKNFSGHPHGHGEADIQAVFEYIGSEGRPSDVLDRPDSENGQQTQRRESIARTSSTREPPTADTVVAAMTEDQERHHCGDTYYLMNKYFKQNQLSARSEQEEAFVEGFL